ncbi:Predicted membrane protein [Slackia heliotrinireducens]|uniref:Integral membrane protein TIGR01906 n=1 Tax=Slackia heliotrinireducens (strain ATCC 29202 / DSM 20476 / NCTC 11029 / RHS 1) TaxID=471855 RepID=C7N537_SLAHD|nr:DUF1461 domain-containing protein [Slackia heliotrinireducens]ACV22022.1 hypothetical protein Shel_09850 [Slackia heliotrinireducens DSM 20476]VEG99947.1 Predicted membrane protein [Slackia heliotrinireducens]
MKHAKASDAAAQRPIHPVLSIVMGVLIACTMAVSLVYAGFSACAVPDQTTRLLANAFSNDADSPFTHDELVETAVVSKRYTATDNDLDAMVAQVAKINAQAAADGRNTDPAGAPVLPQDWENASTEELLASFDGVADQYVLDAAALSHLDDCYLVIGKARNVLNVVAIAAIVLLILSSLLLSGRTIGRALTAAGGLVLAAFAALAIWVTVDFDGFFAAFHSLFFVDGTWQFSWDSLLICMYPEKFWIGMGAVWLLVTVAGCILCLIIGGHLRRKYAFELNIPRRN